MVLSVSVDIKNARCDENDSPLGKRKTGLESPSGRSSKRSPLSDVRTDHNPRLESAVETNRKRLSIDAHSTPFSSTKFGARTLKRDEVQATNEGRASVNKLSEWLAIESAKKSKPKHHVPPLTTATPVRFRMKPKIKKEDVEATDEKRVSVKTLSEWISDDPFEQKKLRHIRSGARVISKARVFEAEKAIVASRQADIKAGCVHERQVWLSGAFKHESEEGRPKPPVYKDKMTRLRSYQNKTKKDDESPEKALKSVNDKKEWLSNAFKKNGHNIRVAKPNERCDAPGILKCASADDAHSPSAQYPTISQQASYDGMKTPFEEKENPVRLYQNSRFPQDDSPEMALKTVQAKQEWLSNAFKKPHATKVCDKECLDEKGKSEEIVQAEKEVEKVKAGDDLDKVSVAERAKWLKAAFK